MKRILGIAAALLLGLTLLSSVLADDLWHQVSLGVDLVIARAETSPGSGIWKWTYTMTHTGALDDYLNNFNAQLLMPAGETQIWGYALESDTGSATGHTFTTGTWTKSLTPPVLGTKETWGWSPTAAPGTDFGVNVFSF